MIQALLMKTGLKPDWKYVLKAIPGERMPLLFGLNNILLSQFANSTKTMIKHFVHC